MNLALTQAHFPFRFRPDKAMSDKELLRFCEENNPFRIEREPNGDLTVMTPANINTSHMSGRLFRFVDEWTEHEGRGFATSSDGGFTLPDGAMRAPDAAWISTEKMERFHEHAKAGFAPFCPEFVIELRSPSDRLPAAKAKMVEWIANGAEVAWLVDPKRKTVTIYRTGESPEELVDPTSVQGSGPIRGFELVMSRIWG